MARPEPDPTPDDDPGEDTAEHPVVVDDPPEAPESPAPVTHPEDSGASQGNVEGADLRERLDDAVPPADDPPEGERSEPHDLGERYEAWAEEHGRPLADRERRTEGDDDPPADTEGGEE